jgi:hypothetical protein
MADWTIQPLEIRVEEPRYPDIATTVERAALPGAEYGADAAAVAALGARARPAAVEPASVRDIIYRNALQDAALARALKWDTQARALELWRVNTVYVRRPMGAEWYLRVRDALFRAWGP